MDELIDEVMGKYEILTKICGSKKEVSQRMATKEMQLSKITLADRRHFYKSTMKWRKYMGSSTFGDPSILYAANELLTMILDDIRELAARHIEPQTTCVNRVA